MTLNRIFLIWLCGILQAVGWETFHGDAGLSGNAEGVFRDRPRILWRAPVPGPVSATCLVDGQRVYAFTEDGVVVAIGLDGRRRWSARPEQVFNLEDGGTDGVAGTGVLLSEGLAVASEDGLVALLAADTGKRLWQTRTGKGVATGLGKGTVENREAVLVMSQPDGVLFALDAGTGKALWHSKGVGRCDCPPSASGDHVVFGSCRAALHVLSIKDGTHRHDIDMGGDGQVAAGAAIVGGTVYAGDRSGMVVAAGIANGTTNWELPAVDAGIFSTPAVDNERVYFGADNGTLMAVGRAAGKPTWRRELKLEPSSPVIVGNRVLTTDDGNFYVLAAGTGEIISRMEVSDSVSPVAVRAGVAYIGTDEGEVIAVGSRSQGRTDQ